MAQDGRDVLEVLRFELSFLQDGGYGTLSSRALAGLLIRTWAST